jgi:predicted lipoprotein with Yx(FWY)xxD motif
MPKPSVSLVSFQEVVMNVKYLGGVLIFLCFTLGTAQETSGGAAVEGPATVGVSQNDELGDFLVDADGMTLYLFTKDTENTSTCYDDCASAWPPLLTDGDPTATAGLDAALLGTTDRTDGATQVTYGGWPLYYWVKDQAPGDTTGQDVGEVWYVVSPAGEAVHE